MKIFKLLIASLVVFSFLFTTNVNAQDNKWGNSGKWVEEHVFDCPCAGENLMGTLVFQMVGEKMVTFKIKGHLVGETTGDEYVFTRVDHINTQTGQSSLRVRTIRKGDGVVTLFTIFYQDGRVWARCM